MRCLTVLILMTGLVSCNLFPDDSVDVLLTEKDVQRFLDENNFSYSEFRVKVPDSLEVSLLQRSFFQETAIFLNKKESFYKADFNSDGKKDLLVLGEKFDTNYGVKNEFNFAYLILLSDSTGYHQHYLSYFNYYSFPSVENTGGKDLLVIYNKQGPDSALTKNTLEFKYGEFIEYSAKESEKEFRKIEFSSSMCLLGCPVCKIEINAGAEARFMAERANYVQEGEYDSGELKGIFSAVIDSISLKEIVHLVKYLHMEDLNDSYMFDGEDLPTYTLNIEFTDGTVKTVSDYGGGGTLGLGLLYRKIFDLRYNQKWQRTADLPRDHWLR